MVFICIYLIHIKLASPRLQKRRSTKRYRTPKAHPVRNAMVPGVPQRGDDVRPFSTGYLRLEHGIVWSRARVGVAGDAAALHAALGARCRRRRRKTGRYLIGH